MFLLFFELDINLLTKLLSIFIDVFNGVMKHRYHILKAHLLIKKKINTSHKDALKRIKEMSEDTPNGERDPRSSQWVGPKMMEDISNPKKRKEEQQGFKGFSEKNKEFDLGLKSG